MRIALILSNYERPELAELCLHSLSLQTRKFDEVLFLDDGSRSLPALNGVDVVIRQEHSGMGKHCLVNRALLEARSDYIVFCDADCVFPPWWSTIHNYIARPRQLIYGMHTSLTKAESALVTRENISDRSVWGIVKNCYEGEPEVFCAAGSACWRVDALAVNGVDTRFGWSGGDLNFGLRLKALGLSHDHFSWYGRYLHLWHERSWAEDKTDWRQGDRKTALSLARLWAKEDGAVTRNGIAEQDMSKIEVIRRDERREVANG